MPHYVSVARYDARNRCYIDVSIDHDFDRYILVKVTNQSNASTVPVDTPAEVGYPEIDILSGCVSVVIGQKWPCIQSIMCGTR